MFSFITDSAFLFSKLNFHLKDVVNYDFLKTLLKGWVILNFCLRL